MKRSLLQKFATAWTLTVLYYYTTRHAQLADRQVIARPKLATPTIYQHGRSPANEHNELGLGATSRPGTRDSLRTSSTRPPTCPTAPWSDGGSCRMSRGYTGAIHAWEDENVEDTAKARFWQSIGHTLCCTSSLFIVQAACDIFGEDADKRIRQEGCFCTFLRRCAVPLPRQPLYSYL